jgi:hypothetical protein
MWIKHTCVSRNLVQPLRLLSLILALPSPARDPRLALVVPHFPIMSLRLYTLCACKLLPFRWRFGLREWLGARELCSGCRELSERAFG